MKTCQANNCISPVFSHNFCQRHQYLRTDAKKPKRSVLRQSAKKPVHSIDFGFETQTDLFAALWENAKDEHGIVTCPYTGERLNHFYGTDIWFSCFAHVLPKGRYIYWKLNPNNIRIVHPNFHKCVDQGTTEIRKKWTGWKFSKWDSEVIALKEAYIQFKKDNLLP